MRNALKFSGLFAVLLLPVACGAPADEATTGTDAPFDPDTATPTEDAELDGPRARRAGDPLELPDTIAAAPTVSVAQNVNEGGFVGDKITWRDSANRPRTAFLVGNGAQDPSGAYGGDVYKRQPVDFVGLRVESTSPRAGATSAERVAAWSARFVDSQGTLCGTAKDKAKCEAAVAAVRELGTTCQGLAIVPQFAAPEAPSVPQGTCETQYLLYTRGDEVGLVRDTREALAFFGPIDSGEEAAYVARAGGEVVMCGGTGGGAGYASVAGGYNVATGEVDCEGESRGRIVARCRARDCGGAGAVRLELSATGYRAPGLAAVRRAAHETFAVAARI